MSEEFKARTSANKLTNKMLRLCIAIGLSLLALNPVSSKSVDRIPTGSSKVANDSPWVAGIFNNFNNSEDAKGFPLLCSGSLIAEQWVLTSKYCVTDGQHFTVYLGARDLSVSEPNRMLVSANKSILNDDADLALIQLSSPVAYNDDVRAVQLPSNDFQEAAGDHVIVSGWGSYSSDPTRLSHLLRKSAATITSDSPCTKEFDSFSASAICTNAALCQGDEGSSLTKSLGDGSSVLIGVASHVSWNCKSTSGFTAIQPHLKWIQSTTNSGPATHVSILNLLITLPLLYICTSIQ